ncbi:multicopper oxidase family protein, partial [Chloroflexus sp.]|uniref:multicopper oxidase family protein n=1 Tax=Chloroflexus sp. TaxID=1904827 RepID=UPI002ADE3022
MLSRLTRRGLLRLFGAGALVFGSGVLNGCALPTRSSMSQPQTNPSPAFTPDLDLTIRAVAAEVPILPGTPTRVWTYQAQVHTGDPAAVQPIPDSYLGPIIRVRTGQKVRITFENGLPDPRQDSIIHWHGLHTPPAMDGHPHTAVRPGERYVYEFTVTDRAGTYWFHPHPHGQTAQQVIMGLAGLFVVSDPAEEAIGLPGGEYDLPLIIQDRTFDADNQFVYDSDPMTRMMGFLGERILVNGRPDLTITAATRAYRWRILNGSNSRIYKLAWDSGMPLTVIATDGGLLERPLTRPFVMLAPGERIELWVDL